jgi:hypothetical protein
LRSIKWRDFGHFTHRENAETKSLQILCAPPILLRNPGRPRFRRLRRPDAARRLDEFPDFMHLSDYIINQRGASVSFPKLLDQLAAISCHLPYRVEQSFVSK